MPSTLTVILKDESRTYKQKFLLYKDYMVNSEDPSVKHCITEALKAFPEAQEIRINIQFEA